MKKILSLVLIFTIVFAMPAFAGTPDVNELDEATRNALSDNNLEYNEIENLVHYYNPSIVQMWKNADDKMEDLRDTKEELSDAIDDLQDALDDAKDAKNASLSNALKANIKYLQGVKRPVSKALDSLDSDDGAINKRLRRIEGNVSNPAKQLMLAYKQITIQNELLTRLVALNTEKYNAAVAGLAAGTGTQNDVTQAMADLQSAQANVSSINASGNNLYDTLKTLCGWSIDGTPVIGEIPQADTAKIAAYNPEADLVYAAGNTDAVTSERVNNTYAKANEVTETAYVKAQLDTLYAQVLASKQSFDAALVGYQAAQMNWNAAQIQLKNGMISRLQYIGMEIAFVQKEAAYKLANIALMQSMLNYETAVNYGV